MRFQLPTSEDELWTEVVAALLAQRRVAARAARDPLCLLEELAFHQRIRGQELTADVVEDTATSLAARMQLGPARPTAQKWIEDLENWELLINRAGIYEFAMPTLDEFFAARCLAGRWARADRRIPFQWLRWLVLWCRAKLPPFRALLRRTEHEQSLLLMVGLVTDATRESALLHAIPDWNRRFRALARARYIHRSVARRFLCDKLFLPIHFLVALWILVAIGSWASTALLLVNFLVTFALVIGFIMWSLRHVRPVVGLRELQTARARDNVSVFVECVRKNARGRAWRGFALIDRAWRSLARYHAVLALGDIADPTTVDLLIGELNSRARRNRWAAAMALANIADRRAGEPLIAALEDRSGSVRAAAAYALGKIADPRAVDALIVATNDKSREVRLDAEISLLLMGDETAGSRD